MTTFDTKLPEGKGEMQIRGCDSFNLVRISEKSLPTKLSEDIIPRYRKLS
jgi:hypothetical protein